MESIRINLIGGEDDEGGNLSYFEDAGACVVEFRYRGKEIKESSSDYFGAFERVRSVLEKENLIPFCYGSSLNVYPSGMCRDMGAGLRAYKLEKGKKPVMSDLVDIFDAGHDVIPATVTKQKEFYDKWLGLKKASNWKFWKK